jgi:hypothetical protein
MLQQLRRHGDSLLYALLFALVFLSVSIIPALGYKPVRFIVTDLNGEPLEGAVVTLETIDIVLVLPPTNEAGVTESVDPIPEGTYRVTVRWRSQYRNDSSLVFSGNIQIGEPYIFELKVNVFPVTIKLVTPKGVPIKGALVYINSQEVGFTKDDGTLKISRITGGSYDVKAMWLGVEVGPGIVDIGLEGIQIIAVQNVSQLTVYVRGAQGQGLNGATVRIEKAKSEIIRKLTDKDGKVEVELPDADYSLTVSYGEFKASMPVLLTTDTIKTIILDVFIELFGVGMSMAQFLLFIIMIDVIVIILAIFTHEYTIYRRGIFIKLSKREEETIEEKKKPPPKKAMKKHIRKVTHIIRNFVKWIVFIIILSFIISMILVIGMNKITGIDLSPQETFREISNWFLFLASSFISIFTTIETISYEIRKGKRSEKVRGD